MTGNDGAIGVAIKANVALVMRGVAKKDTQGGAGSKFMRGCSGEVGVTLTTKDPHALVGGLDAEQSKVGCGKG